MLRKIQDPFMVTSINYCYFSVQKWFPGKDYLSNGPMRTTQHFSWGQYRLWYSIIIDEATDIHNEQIWLSVRWTNHSYEIHEYTLALIQLPNTKAETIFLAIKDMLIRCSLSAEVRHMMVPLIWVASRMEAEAKQTLHLLPIAHTLNLCLKDVINTCEVIRDVLNFIYDLT